MIDLRGRVALVTGAGSGIGRAAAKLLARAGARVMLVDRDSARAEAVAAEIVGAGDEAEWTAADVSRPAEIEAAVQRTLARWGGLDILIANAGISGDGSILELTDAEWDHVLAIDLDGVFYTARAAIPALKRSAHGRIVCTASHYGVIGKEGMAAYSAAKGGVIGLTRSLALELAPHNITVNAVAPGPVDTAIIERTPEQARARAAMLPLGRLGQPEDIGGAMVYLASDLASWMTGNVLQVNGGEFFA